MQEFLLDTLQGRKAVTLFVTHSIEEAVFVSDTVRVLTESGTLHPEIFTITPRSGTRDRSFRRTEAFSSAAARLRKVLDTI